jgi:UDP-N-acetylglucosamine transferase subunit ALG13
MGNPSAPIRVFVTVGTALDPFDRLITFADTIVGSLGGEVTGLCQFGRCRARSASLENIAFLDRNQFVDAIASADVVVTGAGVGTLSMCMRAGHRPLVLPRRHDLGECVNDHQFALMRALAQRGRVVDATQDDIVSVFRRALEDGLRGPPPQDALSLPLIDFSRSAHYRRVPTGAVRALATWLGLDAMRVR